MGDRTDVKIKVSRSTFNKHEKFFRSDEVDAESIDEEYCNETVSLHCSEVNYACWGSLEEFLKSNKIEFDKEWGAGSEYEAGEGFFRIVNGEYREHEIYCTDSSTLETLKALLALHEKDPAEMLEMLKDRIESLSPFEITPLKNENSIRFIKEEADA